LRFKKQTETLIDDLVSRNFPLLKLLPQIMIDRLIALFGDSLTSDILGGQLAGIDTIWFNPKKKNSGEIQPTFEIERLQQLLPLLQH